MPSQGRYSRQLKHWGAEKQRQLEQTTILVAGLGGLGGTVSELLVRAGIGRIYLVDDGRVDWPDLNRQLLYAERDIGRTKVECAAEALGRINRNTAIIPVDGRIDPAFRCPEDLGLVADCLDNYASRFRLEATLPDGAWLVHGAVEGDQGQIVTLRRGRSQSLGELFAGTVQPRGEIAVSGASAAVVASLMTNEIYQVAFGTPKLLDRFLIVSLTDLHFSFLEV